jgi:hypothetical protein
VLAQFAKACRSISDATAEESGFIPIRRLLKRFQASMKARPLLVEGMILSRQHNTPGDPTWLVLVDSEKYQLTEKDLEEENSGNPLPERLRFTIAHELTHSLAFRTSEFGIHLQNIDTSKQRRELVRAIEIETDRLSSLLLVSQKSLDKLFRGRTHPPTAEELARARKAMGVSRPVFISRLRSLSSNDADGLRNGYGLRNVAVGLATWMEGGTATLRKWPTFANFDRNVLPEFLNRLAHQDQLPAAESFPNPVFSLCGGSENTVTIQADAGTANSPRAEHFEVTCSVEETRRLPGSTSIYVVARKGPSGKA